MTELHNNDNNSTSWGISKYKLNVFISLLLLFVLTLAGFTYFFTKADSKGQVAAIQPSLLSLTSTKSDENWEDKSNQYFDDLLNFQTDIHNFIYHYFDKEKWFKQGKFFGYNSLINNRTIIKEKEGQYLIMIEIPGFSKKQISIELVGNALIIKGDNKDSENKKHFKHTITLQSDIDDKNIKSKLEHGLLTITVPRIKGEAKIITIE